MIPTAYPKRSRHRHVSWSTVSAVQSLWLRSILLVFCSGVSIACTQAAEAISARRLMGIDWVVTVHAESAREATTAGQAALDRVAAIERVLSDYDRQSEVSQLIQTAAARPGQPVPVSSDLANTLRKSLDFSKLTQGAFDVTVGPLTVLWRQARKTGRLPNPEKHAAALAATGRGAVILHDEETGPSVSLLHPATRIDFGGIGMGYAIDEAMKLLAGRGITSAMIDASGDIAVSGPPPGRDHWRIAVPPLMRAGTAAANSTATPTLSLVHAAVATSGDAYQAVMIDGIRYSHIIDPRTGLGVIGPAAVTVIAADATTADALSTASSVLGPAAGLALIQQVDGAAARFSWVADDRLRVEASPRWRDFLERP
jgi:thiamine biosynthesis lipoprotein